MPFVKIKKVYIKQFYTVCTVTVTVMISRSARNNGQGNIMLSLVKVKKNSTKWKKKFSL